MLVATDDQQILVTGTAPAPATWLVPGNGQITPRSVFAHYDGTAAATAYFPALKVISDGGKTVGIYPCLTAVAAGGSADVSWFPDVGTVAETVTAPVAGVSTETLFLDTPVASVSTSGVLASSVQYLITVQGTFSVWNLALDVGTPNADAMFPGSVVGRVSTQVGLDAETIFAWPHTTVHTAGHNNAFQINLGSGFVHMEPEGGPYSVAQSNYLYRYNVTGQGAVASFRLVDAPTTDNYGKLQIVVQSFGGSSSGGGGGGSLVPPTTTNYSTLQVVGGIPAWSSTIDGGSA